MCWRKDTWEGSLSVISHFTNICLSYLLLHKRLPQNLMAEVKHICCLPVPVGQESRKCYPGLSQGCSQDFGQGYIQLAHCSAEAKSTSAVIHRDVGWPWMTCVIHVTFSRPHKLADDFPPEWTDPRESERECPRWKTHSLHNLILETTSFHLCCI